MQGPNWGLLLLLSLKLYLKLLGGDVGHVGDDAKAGERRGGGWLVRKPATRSAGTGRCEERFLVGSQSDQTTSLGRGSFLPERCHLSTRSYEGAALGRNNGETTPGSHRGHPRHEPTSVSLSWRCPQTHPPTQKNNNQPARKNNMKRKKKGDGEMVSGGKKQEKRSMKSTRPPGGSVAHRTRLRAENKTFFFLVQYVRCLPISWEHMWVCFNYVY